MASNLAVERAEQYKGKITFHVIFASIIASLGGFIFGYVGVFGNLKIDDIFYDLFVNDMSNRNPRDYDYCKYNYKFGYQIAGSYYLAGSLAAILAYPCVSKYGRRKLIIFSGVVSLIGTLLWALPFTYIAGLIVVGAGIGFGNLAILLYLSEMAPPRFRGRFNTLFQLANTLGILLGNMLEKDSGRYGLRALIVGMGFPVLPAVLLIIGAKSYLLETPNSLIEREKIAKGREVLEKIRGTDDIDAEFQDIVAASEHAKQNKRAGFRAAKNILERRNRPQLVMAIFMPMFQNLTGILVIFVYAPLLFQSLGHRDNHMYDFYSAATNGTILVVSALIALATVDKFGRRVLLISGGILMIICQVIIAVMLGTNLFSEQLNKDELSIFLTVMMGIFVLAYGWSWGPLGWTIPSELFTLETRSVGQSIAVSINLLFTYIVLQFFIPLLCAFNYGLFLFFAGWIVVMTIFVYFLLPETKGVPIEETALLWTNHWFWHRFVAQDSHVLHRIQKGQTGEQV